MTTKVDIDPRVALLELTARADAERLFWQSFYQNRCLLHAQEAHVLRQTVEAQKAEIERLTDSLADADAARELDED